MHGWALLRPRYAVMWFNCDACGVVCALLAHSFLFSSNYVVLSMGTWPKGELGAIVGTLLYESCFVLSVWSHLMAMLSDPGSLPQNVPVEDGERMCKKCQAPKPAKAHHCSICRRCIMRMDHHCPWVNNCVGLRNQKFFMLFMFYVNIQCWMAMVAVGLRMASDTPRPRRRSKAFLVRHNIVETTTTLLTEAGARVPLSLNEQQVLGAICVLLLALIFGMFTSIMMCDQASNIMNGTTGIELLQRDPPGSSKKRPWLENTQEVMGRGPSFRWFLPVSPARSQVKDVS